MKGRDLTDAERTRLQTELRALREERREQMMMLDVLARFRAGDYPHHRVTRRRASVTQPAKDANQK